MRYLLCYLLFAALLSLSGKEAEDPLRKKALAGDPQAMVTLGNEFFQGTSRPRNLALAAFWYRKAALAQVPWGIYRYGACLEFGWGVSKTPRLAFEYYRKASALGAAQMRLAEMLLKGVPAGSSLPAVPQNKAKAKEILRRLCKANYYPALIKLARYLYQDPLLRKKHGNEIYALVLKSANTDTPAPELLTFQAKLLKEGIGTKADPVFARALLEIAANARDPEAEFLFAAALEAGEGTPVKPRKAFEFYSRSAKSNFPAALVRMGDYHLEGKYLSHSPAEAFRLFQQAAAKDFPPALRKLGWCNENGIGTAKDLSKAFSFYERSAKGADPLGNYHTGRCFSEGIGVKADPTAACYFFKRSAASGCREGMLALAEALRTGKGCTPDPELSRRLREAAEKL